MGRFGSFYTLLLAILLTLLTVMACSTEEPELVATSEPTSSAPSSATASPANVTPKPTATSNLITIDCNDRRFTKQILELSEENQNQFSPRILKLYSDAEELERTERILRCKGTASLSRGGESYITYHYEIDRDGDAFIGYEIGDAVSTTTSATRPTLAPPGFTLDNPLSAGEVLQGSDGTEIRVLGIVEDARRQVAEENQFNDPPKEGRRFYMISVEVSYPSGSESLTVGDSDFNLIGENRVVYEPFDHTCGIIPNELDGEIYSGGKIQGNICFEIPEDEGGLILIHEPGYAAESRRFLSISYKEAKEPTPTTEPTAAPITTPKPTATLLSPEPTSALPAPTSTPSPQPAIPTPEPIATPESTSSPKLGFGPGTYEVSSEIQPGVYAGKVGTGPLDSCYWERLSGVSGEFSDLIANDNAVGQFYVEILSTDKYFKIDCDITHLSAWPEPEDLMSDIQPGTYLVGRDIAAGTYRGKAGTGALDSCYWERLSGVSGEFSDLIANDNATGAYFVDVKDSDYALSTACALELVE